MPDQPIKRSRKRIIKRDQLPASKLATTKKPPPKQNPQRKPAATLKAPTTPPSEIRLDNLNASLNAFDVWRNYQPLALGIERAIFQHAARHSLSCSKRVVKKLLHRHTHDRRYLQSVRVGGQRLNLDGTETGAIQPAEQEHAARVLAA